MGTTSLQNAHGDYIYIYIYIFIYFFCQISDSKIHVDLWSRLIIVYGAAVPAQDSVDSAVGVLPADVLSGSPVSEVDHRPEEAWHGKPWCHPKFKQRFFVCVCVRKYLWYPMISGDIPWYPMISYDIYMNNQEYIYIYREREAHTDIVHIIYIWYIIYVYCISILT